MLTENKQYATHLIILTLVVLDDRFRVTFSKNGSNSRFNQSYNQNEHCYICHSISVSTPPQRGKLEWCLTSYVTTVMTSASVKCHDPDKETVWSGKGSKVIGQESVDGAGERSKGHPHHMPEAENKDTITTTIYTVLNLHDSK